MAYTHVQYGVRMDGSAVSTAADAVFPTIGSRFGSLPNGGGGLSVTYNVAEWGSHSWKPGCMPHRIVRVGVETSANLTNPQELIFKVNPRGGTATGEAFRMMLPTNTATGIMTVKTVTNYTVVNPGQILNASVSTAISSVNAKIYLWVEPVWEEIANVTDAQSPTA